MKWIKLVVAVLVIIAVLLIAVLLVGLAREMMIGGASLLNDMGNDLTDDAYDFTETEPTPTPFNPYQFEDDRMDDSATPPPTGEPLSEAPFEQLPGDLAPLSQEELDALREESEGRAQETEPPQEPVAGGTPEP